MSFAEIKRISGILQKKDYVPPIKSILWNPSSIYKNFNLSNPFSTKGSMQKEKPNILLGKPRTS
ncbi:MAG: hypothetical protein NTZ20_02970 [Candidatus Levybacteria bacterium]|nr:hypothetical protein [Candidatus Levybacteria bacterium]